MGGTAEKYSREKEKPTWGGARGVMLSKARNQGGDLVAMAMEEES